MSNPLVIDAVPGTSCADITREFDAPVEALFRAVAARTVAGQALAAGLVDEVAVDLVPVVLGTRHRYFAKVAPAAVIPAARVTHLVLPVER